MSIQRRAARVDTSQQKHRIIKINEKQHSNPMQMKLFKNQGIKKSERLSFDHQKNDKGYRLKTENIENDYPPIQIEHRFPLRNRMICDECQKCLGNNNERRQKQLNIDKTGKRKENQTSVALSISRVFNVVTNFSQLKQIIAFEFDAFQKEIKMWNERVLKKFLSILREKEQKIFELELQNINLSEKIAQFESKKLAFEKENEKQPSEVNDCTGLTPLRYSKDSSNLETSRVEKILKSLELNLREEIQKRKTENSVNDFDFQELL